jgi:hypothetical protein
VSNPQDWGLGMLTEGDLVHIMFLDHAENADKPPICNVYGRLQTVRQGHVVVLGWETNIDQDNPVENPHTLWSIVRGAIIASYRLERGVSEEIG